jgi:dihydrofolate reductase
VVLTRDLDWRADGAEVARSVGQALEIAGNSPVSIIGGAEIFELFLPQAERIELTEVLADVEGDTFMPDLRSAGEFEEVAREDHAAERDRPPFRFVTLARA